MGKTSKKTQYKARSSIQTFIENNKNEEQVPAMTPSWSSVASTSSPVSFLATPQSMDSGSWPLAVPSQDIFFSPNPPSLEQRVFSESGKGPDGEALLLIPPIPIASGFPKIVMSGFESGLSVSAASQEDDNGLPKSMMDFFSTVSATAIESSSGHALMEFMMHDLYDIMDMSLLSGCLTGMAHKSPYPCPYCGTRFSRHQDRERHVNSKHTKSKLYHCIESDCPKYFCRSDLLRRHLRSVHRISNSRQQ
ncbi:hypothetical protein [Absidia glauca]|uniref:C2H2-type domain-containing protein n=1 Tax=Absidia glauca TaxID=4829 RepID=A0A168LLE6_ABSGL|nr:hypothetical protein [Absidia glauca]